MPKRRSAMAGRHLLLLAAALCSCACVCNAGPLPTNSSLEIEKSGSCSVGDVVYLPGDEFPGADLCERCRCGLGGGVACSKQTCQPRPGCKAVHRPDSCCPTYQCECEQEGRVYGNGEKLVDPQDPCRVCYCQGGEVVCRRIACFVRDDCRPRLVPGRCCPEYDNCPLRGGSTTPGVALSESSFTTYEKVSVSSAEPTSSEKPKSEITIKEITPVSEIPAISGVKIMEILPSPNIEVIEYPSSSKAPLIPREANTEKPSQEEMDGAELATAPENTISLSTSSSVTQETNSKSQITADSAPSKISLSTQGFSIEAHSSKAPSAAPELISSEPSITTKAPIVEEEDINPAFPPLPDDLSVLSNHGDEIIPESHIDNEHLSSSQDAVTSTSSATPAPLTTPAPTTLAPVPKTPESVAKTTVLKTEMTTVNPPEVQEPTTTVNTVLKNSPMLNLRAALPTELLNEPLTAADEINGQLDDVNESATDEPTQELVKDTLTTLLTTKAPEVEAQASSIASRKTDPPIREPAPSSTVPALITESDIGTETSFILVSEQTTSTSVPTIIVTEIVDNTELSSLPVETSNQNPPVKSDNEMKAPSTAVPRTPATSVKIVPTEAEPITVAKTSTINIVEISDSTESITSEVSAETSTDAVEIIGVSSETGKNAAVIASSKGKNSNGLTDLINLVGDVASISDHTEKPGKLETTSISSSEEFLPVNSIGYKSKNNNWNVNSITEVPTKSKPSTTTKGKIVELDEDEATITDLPAPHDKNEPTTRRPIIDQVTPGNPKNESDTKEIEIISNSYVPSISRRPTKVVMKKNSGQPSVPEAEAEVSTDVPASAVAPSSPAAARDTAAPSTPPAALTTLPQ